MTTTDGANLEVTDLTLGYGDRDVIHGLDLAVPPGRMTAIVGPMPAASPRCCAR